MPIKKWVAVAVSAIAFAASGASAESARPLPPVEAFGRLPFFADPHLSPDGKYLAAIQDLNGRPAVAIYQMNTANVGEPEIIPDDGHWIASAISWAKNDRLIIFFKEGKQVWSEETMFGAIAISPGNGGKPIALGYYGIGAVLDKDLADPDFIFMPAWKEHKLNLIRVNVRDGTREPAQDGHLFSGQWVLNGQGNVVARVDRLRSPYVDKIRIFHNGDWTDAGEFDASGDNGAKVVGVSLDGKFLVQLKRHERDTLDLLDLATAKPGATLCSNDKYDISGALKDEWTGRVIGAAYVADRPQYVYFDASREAVQRGIEKAFPGTTALAVSADLAGDKMVVLSEAPRRPPTYYYLDRTTHEAKKIASEYPSLEADDLGEMQSYPYKARDGLDIPAYLTLPTGRPGKNLPLVVMPHGGPDARDSMRFNWWAQFLVSRGYAVFQPNYRGSSGYGHAFTEAGLHQWGLKMQDDITDGVRKLIADGVADPKRICIVGGSYGGYAALAGATFTPDLYKCAVSFAGVSNLRSMLERAGAGTVGIDSFLGSFWISRIGDLSNDSAQIDATSPALHADKVKIPILLMHGTHDTTVPIEESEQEAAALKRAGKQVTFIKFDSDDHYFSLAATRIGMLTQLEKFLHDNIGS